MFMAATMTLRDAVHRALVSSFPYNSVRMYACVRIAVFESVVAASLHRLMLADSMHHSYVT